MERTACVDIRALPLQLLLRKSKVVAGGKVIRLQAQRVAVESYDIFEFAHSESRHRIEHDGVGITAVHFDCTRENHSFFSNSV